MKRVSSIFGYGTLLFLFIAAVAILRPVPILKESRCLATNGIVKHIYEGGEHDVVFTLQGDRTRYYINRGLEQGLDLDELKSTLLGQKVTIKYPKYWTPFDWDNSIRHLSKLETEDRTIFNECKTG